MGILSKLKDDLRSNKSTPTAQQPLQPASPSSTPDSSSPFVVARNGSLYLGNQTFRFARYAYCCFLATFTTISQDNEEMTLVPQHERARAAGRRLRWTVRGTAHFRVARCSGSFLAGCDENVHAQGELSASELHLGYAELTGLEHAGQEWQNWERSYQWVECGMG